LTRQIALQLAFALAISGAVGLFFGIRSAPLSEGEIISQYAAEYVAETGGARTDCYGVPTGVEGVRMMVICEAVGREAWFRAVGAQGEQVDAAPVFDEGAT